MIRIEIETTNAAFEGHPGMEVARILEDLARRFRDGEIVGDGNVTHPLRDVNGNTVGRVEVEDV